MEIEKQTTQDKLWVPSYIEIFNSINNGGYSLFSQNNNSRLKSRPNLSYQTWWLRDYQYSSYNYVDYCKTVYAATNGSSTYASYTSASVTNEYGIPLCFCT